MNDLLKTLLELATSPSGIATIVGVVFGGIGLLTGTNAIRRRRVALAVYHAFHLVEDLDNELGTEHLDKVSSGLKAADEWMRANGWRALKPSEQEVAKLGFTALNGQMHASAKVAAQAQALTASPQ